jgi:hypothetical protein
LFATSANSSHPYISQQTTHYTCQLFNTSSLHCQLTHNDSAASDNISHNFHARLVPGNSTTGQQQQQGAGVYHTLSMPSAAGRTGPGRPPITTSTQLPASLSAPGPMTGQGRLMPPSQLAQQQAFGVAQQVDASPFAIGLPVSRE